MARYEIGKYRGLRSFRRNRFVDLKALLELWGDSAITLNAGSGEASEARLPSGTGSHIYLYCNKKGTVLIGCERHKNSLCFGSPVSKKPVHCSLTVIWCVSQSSQHLLTALQFSQRNRRNRRGQNWLRLNMNWLFALRVLSNHLLNIWTTLTTENKMN